LILLSTISCWFYSSYNYLQSIQGTETAYQVSAQANAARAAGKTVYSFHIGDLNFRTPNAIVEATKKAMDEGKTGYVPADVRLVSFPIGAEHSNLTCAMVEKKKH